MNPLLFILIILIGLPITEIYFLIEVGSIIGAIPTIIITILTAVTGISLIRIQGLNTLVKLQASMQQGHSPAIEILEGGMLLIAAISLLMPGFLSDSLGFLLLIPPLRHALAKLYLTKKINSSAFLSANPHHTSSHNSSYNSFHNKGSEFIEGEFEDVSERDYQQKIEKK